jgi:hypothetical protein
MKGPKRPKRSFGPQVSDRNASSDISDTASRCEFDETGPLTRVRNVRNVPKHPFRTLVRPSETSGVSIDTGHSDTRPETI